MPKLALRDHPRAYGEKNAKLRAESNEPGSPPRVRGKEEEIEDRLYWSGITPARTGKRPISAAVNIRHRDHPRAYGEKS